MVTINDIAKEAGVAKSTVSRYLNNGSVSADTRRKIDKIIEKTGYTPNNFARSLKAQKTNMIGVMIPRLNSASTNEVLEGIDEMTRKLGYQLIITNSDQNNEREFENIQTLAKQKVEGVIMFARELTPEHIDTVKKTGTPFLFIGQKAEGIHSIIHQDYQAGAKIGTYAIELGHRHFLYVGVPEKDRAVGVERRQGFLDAVRPVNGSTVEKIESDFSRTSAYQKALAFLPKTEATYIVCATDNIAVAVLKAAKDLGYSIPEDFSLSGFGGYEATAYVSPTITTVSYPYREMGLEAVKKLVRLIGKEEVPNISEMGNELVINQSTAYFDKI
ncbi:LacI family DNA-binding transcriptional regulator [Alkalibacterium olivapovliticus]|uniref:LacI family sucrose operon transcriptional repressor n=1 Tax=Alkalibacterium olivapovliticus TaxID=99907 RepID=A0A2T0W9R8_9LACT|nr:LacI family DNA-binding transcriptional regulator [Alkalibacterium olivapovliticus]PRY83437.1 LacI family sucrose operon transcriptional repressor [Alkalibacterium olivapovliticus]